jgi:hypothetical protein
MGDPYTWDSVPQELNTLGPKQWLGGALMDYVLLRHWLKIHHAANVYFIDFITIRHFCDRTEPTEMEFHHSRRRLLIPEGPIDLKPVLLPVLEVNHYFLVIFDYSSKRAHILGRNIGRVGPSSEIHWESWNGPKLWNMVAKLFGWMVTSSQSVIKSGFDWLQVSGDSSNNHVDILPNSSYAFRMDMTVVQQFVQKS